MQYFVYCVTNSRLQYLYAYMVWYGRIDVCVSAGQGYTVLKNPTQFVIKLQWAALSAAMAAWTSTNII
jgi:hypothetical protein